LFIWANHHVGPNGRLTPFYRLPDKNDPVELANIYNEFHLVPAKKLNFIRIMSAHLQKSVDDKGKIIPTSERRERKRNGKSLGNGGGEGEVNKRRFYDPDAGKGLYVK
jgi:hypothetical protein